MGVIDHAISPCSRRSWFFVSIKKRDSNQIILIIKSFFVLKKVKNRIAFYKNGLMLLFR